MTRITRRFHPAVLAASLGLLLPPACDSGGGTDSNTHWLEPCEAEADCGGALACICGLCTEPCESDATCNDLSSWARCEALSRSSCDGHAVRACVATCEVAEDCPREGLACVDGQCVRPREDAGPVSTSDAGGGGSAGESGSGGAAAGAASGGNAGAGTGGATAGSAGLGGTAGAAGTATTGGSGAGADDSGAPDTDGGATPVDGGAADASEAGSVVTVEAGAPDAEAGPPPPCAPDFLVGWGDENYQLSRDVALDSGGNTIVAGYFDYVLTGLGGEPYMTADPPAGYEDGFVAKLDADGNAIWRVQLGSPSGGTQYALTVTVDQNDNVIVGGVFEVELTIDGTTLFAPGGFYGKDAFVARLSGTDGSLLEIHEFGGMGVQWVLDVKVDPVPPHAIIAVGDFDTEIDCGDGTTPATCPSAGGMDIFIAKIWDSTTRKVWTYGGPDNQWARALDVDATGSMAIAGQFKGSFSFGGGTPTLTAIVGTDPALTDAYVARLYLPATTASAPNPVFAREFHGGGCPESSHRTASAVAFDRAFGTSGNVWVGGEFWGCIDVSGTRHDAPANADGFLVRLDHGTGTPTAERYLTGTSSQTVGNLAVDEAGYLFVTGTIRGASFDELGSAARIGIEDTFVLRMDPAGAYDWVGWWGGAAAATAGPHIAVRNAGSETMMALSGNYTGTIGFGGDTTITGAGNADPYAVRMTCAW